MTRCRACKKPIRFVRTAKGKRMPIDVHPSPEGNVELLLPAPLGDVPEARVLAGLELDAARAAGRDDLHTSHFATCPEADRFRRPRRKAQKGAR